jgi:anaerobic selenocysteine-containing dehydrogenase
MGFRGDGTANGRGAPNPDQLQRYIANGGFCQAHVPEEAAFYKPWNAAYQDWAVKPGIYDTPQPYLFSLWSEPMRRFQLAAEGFGPASRPTICATRLKQAMDPLPVWYAPYGDEDAAFGYPVHALTQRPMDMYHSWGSQNAWLRQIKGRNYLYLPTAIWQAQGFREGTGRAVTSPGHHRGAGGAYGGAERKHVWTWNAIGKRKGPGRWTPDAPRGDDRLPAEPPDLGAACRTRARAGSRTPTR